MTEIAIFENLFENNCLANLEALIRPSFMPDLSIILEDLLKLLTGGQGQKAVDLRKERNFWYKKNKLFLMEVTKFTSSTL